MKKTLIALTVLLSSAMIATAQQKSPEALRSAVDKAETAAENPKKAGKPDTWMKIGKAYVEAYNGPMGQLWIGASQAELQLVTGNAQPLSVETVDLGGTPCQKQVFADKDLYFNQNGQLVLINVTKPVYEDALAKALEAYAKLTPIKCLLFQAMTPAFIKAVLTSMPNRMIRMSSIHSIITRGRGPAGRWLR